MCTACALLACLTYFVRLAYSQMHLSEHWWQSQQQPYNPAKKNTNRVINFCDESFTAGYHCYDGRVQRWLVRRVRRNVPRTCRRIKTTTFSTSVERSRLDRTKEPCWWRHFRLIRRLVTTRVRTILALGYWLLGNICRYWVVLLLVDIFFIVTPNTIPVRQQSAPSTW